MKDRVFNVISEYCGNKDIKEDMNFTEDLGLNSLDLVELVVRFEDEFDVEISDRDFHKFMKVSDVIDYLENIE